MSSVNTVVLLQDECYKHQFIRSKDISLIVERPERLRALKIGFAAAIARLEELHIEPKTSKQEVASVSQGHDADIAVELSQALDTLTIGSTAAKSITTVCEVTRLPVTLQYLSSDPAVRLIHAANPTGDGFDNLEHLDRLARWARESEQRIKNGEIEIPDGFPQNDLYMCPQSYRAICGAVETVREAVNRVMTSPSPMVVFAAIRPPGHHCGEDTPSGFCFVNNVAIGAAHAHVQFGVKRVIIFDIDLHHGNGTQAIAWAINAESNRKRLSEEAVKQSTLDNEVPQTMKSALEGTPGLQIFYASLHDILSFPCEDGDPALVRDASVSIAGAHGQYIENVHLQPYTSHEDFWTRLYPQYQSLFSKALDFIRADPQDLNVPIFISCGFDASELEYESMSRHGRKVPVGFYYRFTKDAKAFASKFSNGKIISVLEGGYSDRTLMAGGMAHLAGLVEGGEGTQSGPEEWWNDNNLESLEKACKKRRGRQSTGKPVDQWIERTVEILASIDPYNGQASPSPSGGSRKMLLPINQLTQPPTSSTMSLRERKKPMTPPEPGSNLPLPLGNSRPRKSGNGQASPARKIDVKSGRKQPNGDELPSESYEDSKTLGTHEALPASLGSSVETRPAPLGSTFAGPTGVPVHPASVATQNLVSNPPTTTTPPPRKLPRIILRVREPEI
ncbi:hypothetical protein FRC17_002303 [Serendipita sp. 399]|nr:hypothetical protein FRC17_002303 [Serendipita sp. 399]